MPTTFPPQLLPHLEAVHETLSELASQHGAKAVTRASLAHVLAAPTRRHKPFVQAAHDFAAWAAGKAQSRKDVVAGYRNWLERTDDLAALEQTGPSSTPTGAGAGRRADALEQADRWRKFYPDQEAA